MPFALIRRPDVAYPALLGCLYLLFRAYFWHHPPIWDAGEYYENIIAAQAQPFDLLAFGTYHNSQLWFWLAGLPNYIFPHNYVAFNIWLSLLSTACVLCQYYVIRHLAQNQLAEGELFLAACLLAFHPAISCNLVHFNTDMGIFIFMSLLCLALLKQCTWLALVSAVFMMFSKETAVVLLLLVYAFCTLLQPVGERWAWSKRHSISVIIPYALLALYCYYKIFIRNEPLLYKDTSVYSPSPFMHIGIDGDSFISYLMMGFILNCNWLIVLLCMALAYMARKSFVSAEKIPYWSRWPAYVLLYAGTALVVFSIRHFNNTRYLLPFYFAFLLTFFYLFAAIRSVRIRHAILSILLVLMVWQNFRTIDPVSRRVFCNTQWGDHIVLNVTHCLNHDSRMRFLARDPLVYNMEFTYVPRLLQVIYQDLSKADPSVTVAVSAHYAWHLTDNPAVVALEALPDLMRHRSLHDFYLILFPLETYGGLPKSIVQQYAVSGTPQFLGFDGYKFQVFHYVHQ